MTDLTYCYLHMTRNDLLILDTIDTPDYIKGELSDDELEVPYYMVPPNPDDSDVLPSQVHPSYPYGNPTSIKHPAARPRPPYDPFSRALFEDMGYGGGGIAGSLRWKDLALDEIMPIDEEKEEADRALRARSMASGTSNHNPQPSQQPPPAPPQDQTMEEDEDEEDENDENEVEEDEEEVEEDGDESYED